MSGLEAALYVLALVALSAALIAAVWFLVDAWDNEWAKYRRAERGAGRRHQRSRRRLIRQRGA